MEIPPPYSPPVLLRSTTYEDLAPGGLANFYLYGHHFKQMAAKGTLTSEKTPPLLLDQAPCGETLPQTYHCLAYNPPDKGSLSL